MHAQYGVLPSQRRCYVPNLALFVRFDGNTVRFNTPVQVGLVEDRYTWQISRHPTEASIRHDIPSCCSQCDRYDFNSFGKPP